MTDSLLQTYLDIDQKLFENIPDESVANIIKRKAVFDSILNRDAGGNGESRLT